MTEHLVETEFRDDFRKADDGQGLTIEFDEVMTNKLHRMAEERIREQREWFEPQAVNPHGISDEQPKRIALHLSDVNKCLRQGYWNRMQIQEIYDETGYLGLDPLSGPMIQRFGRGYALQEFFIGRHYKEKALWSDKYRLIYSPDGGADTPLEFKTTVSSPIVKGDKTAGFSIEDVLMHGGTRDTYYARAVVDWKRYMLQTMHLRGWNHYYLSIVFINGGEWLTFKYTASPERIQREIDTSLFETKVNLLHGDKVPGVEWRAGDYECTECPFLSLCAEELNAENFRG